MERQTGDYLLGTVFLSATLAFAISHGTTESAIWSDRDGFRPTADTAYRELAPDPGLFRKSESSRSRRQIAVIREIPQGSRIIIGSLDVSGARHTVSVKVGGVSISDGEEKLDWLPVYRRSASELRQRSRQYRDQETNLAASAVISIKELRLPRSHVDPGRENAHCALPAAQSRIFLTPHFGDAGPVHELAECRMVYESPRVRVFADRRMVHHATADFLCPAMLQRLTAAVETRALPIVEEWIGEVADLDDDHKLSIVVTDLNRQQQLSSEQTPVYGCIRETDFNADSDFCGDIIYVDPGILKLPVSELAALLTHELTHAAICTAFLRTPQESRSVDLMRFISPTRQRGGISPMFLISKTSLALQACLKSTDRSGGGTAVWCAGPKTRQLPSWINEAIAHFVELQCCEQSPNFQRRIDCFLADSSGCPIVAAESVLSLQERRAGSRCAATWFLSRYFSSPQAIRDFLCSNETILDRRIAEVAAPPFDMAFREWTLSLATTDPDRPGLRIKQLTAADSSFQFSLLGTAFLCVECPADTANLTIEADATTQLQVSVLESPGNPPVTR